MGCIIHVNVPLSDALRDVTQPFSGPAPTNISNDLLNCALPSPCLQRSSYSASYNTLRESKFVPDRGFIVQLKCVLTKSTATIGDNKRFEVLTQLERIRNRAPAFKNEIESGRESLTSF